LIFLCLRAKYIQQGFSAWEPPDIMELIGRIGNSDQTSRLRIPESS
jgi:hypothetical protein